MHYIDFDKLAAVDSPSVPFPHVLCENFIRPAIVDDIHRDFPPISDAGSFPLSTLKPGAAFLKLLDEICDDKVAALLAEKLNAPIVGRPTMITVRGFCRPSDGKIHRDSSGKMITVLLYLNQRWETDNNNGGQLRLLYNGEEINNYFLETPPGNGLLLAFRCDNNAWHGHLPFSGERRAIQLNWVVSRTYQRREAIRHFVSATAKKVHNRLFRQDRH